MQAGPTSLCMYKYSCSFVVIVHDRISISRPPRYRGMWCLLALAFIFGTPTGTLSISLQRCRIRGIPAAAPATLVPMLERHPCCTAGVQQQQKRGVLNQAAKIPVQKGAIRSHGTHHRCTQYMQNNHGLELAARMMRSKCAQFRHDEETTSASVAAARGQIGVLGQEPAQGVQRMRK